MSSPYQLLPPLSDQEYEDLKADIAANGIEQAIIVDDLGNIIDGHHRAQIADELGVDCPIDVRVIDSEEAKRGLALRLNVHRRSLSQAQKRELLATLIKAEPEKSDRQHAAAVGVSHVTAGAVRSELETTGQIDQSDERIGADGRTIRPAKPTIRTTETEPAETSHGINAATYNPPKPVPWSDDENALREADVRRDGRRQYALRRSRAFLGMGRA